MPFDQQSRPDEQLDFRALVEDATDGIVVLARDGSVIFANRGAAELTGYSQKDLPELNLGRVLTPDAFAKAAAIRAVRHAGGPAPARYESALLRADGTHVPIEVNVMPITWVGEPADVVIFRDISARKHYELDLLRREAVLCGVATAAAALVGSMRWLDQTPIALELLGRALSAHRAYMWEAHTTPDGEVRTLNRRFWVDPAHDHRPETLSFEGFPLRASGYGAWLDTVMKGEPVLSYTRDYPKDVTSHETLGIRSVLSLPIMVDEGFWGVLGLSDCESEREWLPFEIDALRTIASIMGSLIRRERVREDLRRSEERLRTTIEQAPTGIFITDEQGWLTEANRSGCEMLGYTLDEMLRMRISDTVSPEMLHLVHAHFEQVRLGEAPRIELPLVTKSGGIIHAEVLAKRLSDGRMQAILCDITARKSAEEEIRRHVQILQAVSFAAEHFPTFPEWEEWVDDLLERIGRATGADRAFIYENRVEPDGEHVVIRRNAWMGPGAHPYPGPICGSKYSLRSLGFGPWIEYAGREPWQARKSALPPPVQDVFESIGAKAIVLVPIQVEDTWWGILGLTDCGCEREWPATDVDALRTAGNIIGAMIQRLRIEAALVESEAKYRSLVEGARLSIAMVNRDGIFEFANSIAADRLGIPVEKLIGMSMWKVFPEERADVQVGLLRRAIDEQELAVVEMPTLVKGEERWHETTINPLIDSEGQCNSALVIVSDITKRKRAEERLLSHQERLRALSSELGLIELRERRRIAGELHDRIGQTLAIAKMRLGALRKTAGAALGAGIDEIRGLIDQTIEDTRSLTFDLSPPILDELGLEPALEWSVERFRGEHGIQAAFRDDGAKKPLGPDVRAFLFRSVQELLINIVKHASARNVEVLAARSGAEIQITVVDDGVGFDPVDVTDLAFPTAGFGLFSIRERISSLGGRVDVRSAAREGTMIVLTAPLQGDPPDGGMPA